MNFRDEDQKLTGDIDAVKGFTYLVMLGAKIHKSLQFRPRGHYTENKQFLARYRTKSILEANISLAASQTRAQMRLSSIYPHTSAWSSRNRFICTPLRRTSLRGCQPAAWTEILPQIRANLPISRRLERASETRTRPDRLPCRLEIKRRGCVCPVDRTEAQPRNG